MSSNLNILEQCLYSELGWSLIFFQSCGHCWVFQICWHIECNTLIASSFRIWNRSAGIPTHPPALLVPMLPKAHLPLHSRMSRSRWVMGREEGGGFRMGNTCIPVADSFWYKAKPIQYCKVKKKRHFLYNSFVYSCHLILNSSAFVRSILFLSFIMPIISWNSPLISPI